MYRLCIFKVEGIYYCYWPGIGSMRTATTAIADTTTHYSDYDYCRYL